jgi:hypothetical protein
MQASDLLPRRCIALQSALIRSGNFSGATAIDVADIKNKFSDGRYGAAIGQMLAYTACLKQNGYIFFDLIHVCAEG